MSWIKEFQLFLFDLDGLLVNTEEIHFKAYQRMFSLHGVELKWDFDQYCRISMYSSTGLREQICMQYPDLLAKVSSWDILYAEKKQAVIDLLHEGAVHLMPGVYKFLSALQDADVARCVVTHSTEEMVSAIRRKNPILDTIPKWIMRGNYTHPKPHPECYFKAINSIAKPADKVIGFEDSPRGLRALMCTQAKPVLVCDIDYPEIPALVSEGVLHYRSFEEIPSG